MNPSSFRTRLAMLGHCSALFLALIIAPIQPAEAVYVGPIPNMSFKVGLVMARSIVVDPETGQPILVEFDEQGKEVTTVDTGGLNVEDLTVYPAADYRFYKKQLAEYRDQYKGTLAKNAELLSHRQFEQRSFLLADNKTAVQQDPLSPNVKSVLVRSQNNLGLDPAQSSGSVNDTLVLLKFDIDLSQEINITESNVSLLVNDEGQIIANSDNNIGFRVGFFGDPNEPQDQRGYRVDNDDTVFGPIPNVKVSVNEFVYRGGIAVTRDDGRYSFQFMMPICPVGGFTYITDVTTELRYRNFLPTGAPSIPYYLRTPGYSYCYADLVPAFIAPTVIGILAATSVPNIQSNLYADVMFAIGKIELRNPMNQTVELGETTYTTFDELPHQVTQKFYDFNGDNEPDYVEQGRVFSCQDDADPEADKPVTPAAAPMSQSRGRPAKTRTPPRNSKPATKALGRESSLMAAKTAHKTSLIWFA
jgi:hypothetical protein